MCAMALSPNPGGLVCVCARLRVGTAVPGGAGQWPVPRAHAYSRTCTWTYIRLHGQPRPASRPPGGQGVLCTSGNARGHLSERAWGCSTQSPGSEGPGSNRSALLMATVYAAVQHPPCLEIAKQLCIYPNTGTPCLRVVVIADGPPQRKTHTRRVWLD